MPFMIPDLILDSVTDIDADLLEKNQIHAIILDVDNTLTTHGNLIIHEDIINWIASMRKKGIKLVIVSNNTEERVGPIAKKLGLDFVFWGLKPMTVGINRACRKLGVDVRHIAIVGDQIFTDVLGGNIKGIFTILVSPLEMESFLFFRLKRKLENRYVKKYYKRLEKKNRRHRR